ncbi:1,3-beta-glucan synthase component-domain-containing protein [Dactylonectria macrodidyma]|uniref:1,3-beta-glucan synthase n=1 Tax=Dactylonectria macrodidyma TaxID=307937 RepID=A0A9P9J4L0_9HYPO|nr:1,3-beta-glucan synthase component-domain-containing protein [Dactylonectria macrodidyma]
MAGRYEDDHMGYDEAHDGYNQPEQSRNPYWGETYQESDYGGVDSAASHNAAGYFDDRYDYQRDDTQYEQYQDNGYGYQSSYADDYDGYDERYESDQRRFGEFDGMHDNGEPGSYNYSRSPSQASFGAGASNVSSKFPIDYSGDLLSSSRMREPYPAWASDANVPISKEEIEDVFLDLTAKFGFQRDSMRNMYDHLMTLLDSRASRKTPIQALISLHADYIGGENANYRKWYFAAGLELDGKKTTSAADGARSKKKKKSRNVEASETEVSQELGEEDTPELMEERWRSRMRTMLPHDRVRQLALYLLCWGEANQVRFMPECLCFIFKCTDDYYESLSSEAGEPVEEYSFLNHIITPLYQYLRDQGYEIRDGVYVRRERDHDKTIGYDDCNQLFWYHEGLQRIVLSDKKTRLIDFSPSERYLQFKDVDWKKSFFKTYKETRSWSHLVVNFNRIWILHLTMFWFYTAANSPTLIVGSKYEQQVNQSPPKAKQMSMIGFGGAVATLIQILATIIEWAFVPRRWPGAQKLSIRLLILIAILALNVAPGIKIFFFPGPKKLDYYLSMGHVSTAVQTFLLFVLVPSSKLFTNPFKKSTGRVGAVETFTAAFPPLHGNNVIFSKLFWAIVFGAKFGESYVFLTLSFKDPIRYISIMNVDSCRGDRLLGTILCRHQPHILLGLMMFTDLIFFFLDTYLWYVLVNTVFSVLRSFFIGSTIWTPWRNIFVRLPKRIYSKVLATTDMEIKYKPKVLISQVWNAVVISMYREHLLGIEHVQKLLYHQVPSEVYGKRTLRAPTFFVAQGDNWLRSDFYPKYSEAERRISFFAQSLSTPIPAPMPVDNMPTFTVLIPHYSEKVLFSLREIIREDDHYSRLTMLDYLKQLHPHEWACFVEDTKALANESPSPENSSSSGNDARDKVDDIPFYCIGFKSSAPEYTLRTRIWASLRSQTLYRTVSGFMNYSRALKLLYRVENPEITELFRDRPDALDRQLERMARRKFRMVIAMQRYAKFSSEEMENAEFLLRAYPDLQIAYLDEDPPTEDGEPSIYSCLIDGHSEILENGSRSPKFRIRLSGNPILGDGKSDNQNHALIFHRGEYIQLVDANQDNYLEECLKIRSVLAEFEEIGPESDNPYDANADGKEKPSQPVAILGAREYIFSENTGVLGDIAAGKEQTFGTLFARTLAQLGGKLHYGHPDFLNGIFMTTRGGVSKAQKGLHLNEDIFAGMNAVMRGGRIKHCEYYQCGKGRDLGFGSILNFITKIGTGMGEQMLSREYYYLGTQLPLDRFLSFFYAHPGFHLNNIFIMLSVQLFLVTLLNLGALKHETISCHYNRHVPITDPLYPTGCANTNALEDWVYRCVISIVFVFIMSFIPLTVQDLLERDPWVAFQRLAKHVLSFSAFFEVFVCQVYSNAVQQNLALGGARYIGTGRGFATARIPFGVLYARFAGPSIYFGIRLLLILLFATCTIWQGVLVWFWITVLGLTISPFLYNPHQFAWSDFFIDYRDFVRWLFRGHSRAHASSWIAYCRLSRVRTTGYKRKTIGDPSDQMRGDVPRAPIQNILFSEVLGPLFLVAASLIPYLFINAQTGVLSERNDNERIEATDSLVRLLIVTVAPIAINMGMLAAIFAMSCLMGPLLNLCCKSSGRILAGVAHVVAIVSLVISFEGMFLLEHFNFKRCLTGAIAAAALHTFIIKLITTLALTREMKTSQASRAFWTGQWYSLGRHSVTQPAREFLCKVTEMSMFAADFMLGHFLLFLMLPIIAIPRVDMLHSSMLFWLQPSRQIRAPVYSMKQSKLRQRRVVRWVAIYFLMLVVFLGLIVAPAVAGKYIPSSVFSLFEDLAGFHLLQPNGQDRNNTNGTQQTGTGMVGYTGAGFQTSTLSSGSTATSGGKIRLF